MVSFPVPPPSAGISIFSFDVCTLGAWQRRAPVVSPSLGLRRRQSCRLNVLCRRAAFFFFFIRGFFQSGRLLLTLQRGGSLVSASASFSPSRKQNNNNNKKRLEITHRLCGRAPSDNNTRGFEEKSYCLCYTCCFDRPQIHRPSTSRPPGSRLWAAAQIR